MTLLAPFPYFGGKRGVASAIWRAFGDVQNYVEPFFGSGAVLLQRPQWDAHRGDWRTPTNRIETVNDLDGFVANFWRAVAHAPDDVANFADWPVNENDLFARHLWLVEQRSDLAEHLHADPNYHDAKIAGWWVWGACAWIGSGWCDGNGPWSVQDGAVVANAGRGVNRQLPHLGDAGRGVNRQLPHLGDAGQGVQWTHHLQATMRKLGDRLRRVRVCSGDWGRVVTDSVTFRHGLTGVFLDPPYGAGAFDYSAGGNGNGAIADDVRAWATANGENPEMRIALCGYEPLAMPAGWWAHKWTARKGYQANGNESAAKEIVWFSPHCLRHGMTLSLFDEVQL